MGQCCSSSAGHMRELPEHHQLALSDLTLLNTKVFLPDLSVCKVIEVYDGDTIVVALILHNLPFKFRIRLRGIDAPEMRTKSANEKIHAIKSRDYLSGIVLNHIVSVINVGFDKYGGRYLGDVTLNNNNISEMMIQANHAKPYDGGTKESWSEQNV